MKTYVVDKISGRTAFCKTESGSIEKIELIWLPKSVKEGDVIQYIAGRYVLEDTEAEKRKQKIRAGLSDLFPK